MFFFFLLFCMIMMYNELQPWIDNYQVFVWVLVGPHHSFVILQTWILKVFNKNTISALVCLSGVIYYSGLWLSLCVRFSTSHVHTWRVAAMISPAPPLQPGFEQFNTTIIHLESNYSLLHPSSHIQQAQVDYVALLYWLVMLNISSHCPVFSNFILLTSAQDTVCRV